MSAPTRLRLHYQRWLRGMILAQLWAFVIVLPALARTTTVSARYHHFWTVYSTPVRLSCAILLGLALFLVGGMLREASPKWHARIAVWAAVAVAAAVGWRLIVFVAVEMGMRIQTVMGYPFHVYVATIGLLLSVVVVVARRYGVAHVQWKSWLEVATLFFSPMPVIFWINMFLATTYPIHRPIAAADVRAASAPSPGGLPGDNTYIFVLDAWCSRLTFSDDGEVRPMLEHLSEASEEMWFFSQALSPATSTHESMTRFLFQRDEPVKLRGPSIGFELDDGFRATTALDSVFSEPWRQGYTTYMVGWAHPYHVMLSGHVHFVAPSCLHKWLGTRPWHEAVEFFQNVAIDVGGDPLTVRLKAMRDNLSLIFNQSHVVRNVISVLDDPRDGQFAVFHLPVPHTPCCFGPHGVKSLSIDYTKPPDDVMFQQIRYTDSLLGLFFDKLRTLGKYEQSTIVLTSDHNWRQDKYPILPRQRAYKHVPLLIKFPAPECRKVVCQSPVSTNRVLALIADARDVGYDFSQLEEAMAEGGYLSEADKRDN